MTDPTPTRAPALRVQHACPGRDCHVCAMAARGYVRSHGGFWWRPDAPGNALSDDEARRLLQPSLFEEVRHE